MPVTIRNNHSTIISFSTRRKDAEAVEWAPADDPDGGDVQQVPDEFASNPNLIRAIAYGLMSIEEGNEALADAVARQKARFTSTAIGERAAIEAIVHQESTAGVLRFTEDQLDAHFDAVAKRKMDTSPLVTQGASR